MAAQSTILITGSSLEATALQLARDAGYAVVFAPENPSPEVLSDLVRQHAPVGVLTRAGKFGAVPMRAARGLKVVSKHGAGVDNIDVATATECGIQVVRAPGANALSVAEHALTAFLATVKQIKPLDASMRNGAWVKNAFSGREVAGMRIGLVGVGAIGVIASRLFRGIGLTVCAYDPFVPEGRFQALGIERCEGLEQMLAATDAISLHCPLTDLTRDLIDAAAIARMPRGSFLINTARGAIVNEAALAQALTSGHLAGAAIDAFAEEPLGETPLLEAPNLLISPHVAGATEAALRRVATAAVEAIIAIDQGRPLDAERLVNTVGPGRASAAG